MFFASAAKRDPLWQRQVEADAVQLAAADGHPVGRVEEVVGDEIDVVPDLSRPEARADRAERQRPLGRPHSSRRAYASSAGRPGSWLPLKLGSSLASSAILVRVVGRQEDAIDEGEAERRLVAADRRGVEVHGPEGVLRARDEHDHVVDVAREVRVFETRRR